VVIWRPPCALSCSPTNDSAHHVRLHFLESERELQIIETLELQFILQFIPSC
jgi:hypothetical protein